MQKKQQTIIITELQQQQQNHKMQTKGENNNYLTKKMTKKMINLESHVRAIMTMNDNINAIELLEKLMENKQIESLIDSIPMKDGNNIKKRVIDYENVPRVMKKLIGDNEEYTRAAGKVVTFFDKLHYSCIAYRMESAYRERMSRQYEKLLVVAFCAEGVRLGKEIDVKSIICEIPKSLIHLSSFILNTSTYRDLLTKHADNVKLFETAVIFLCREKIALAIKCAE